MLRSGARLELGGRIHLPSSRLAWELVGDRGRSPEPALRPATIPDGGASRVEGWFDEFEATITLTVWMSPVVTLRPTATSRCLEISDLILDLDVYINRRKTRLLAFCAASDASDEWSDETDIPRLDGLTPVVGLLCGSIWLGLYI